MSDSLVICEGCTYANGVDYRYWRTVESITLIDGRDRVYWHADGWTGQRGKWIRTRGWCWMSTFKRWAKVGIYG